MRIFNSELVILIILAIGILCFGIHWYSDKKYKERFIELSIKEELTIEEKKELLGIVWDKDKRMNNYYGYKVVRKQYL